MLDSFYNIFVYKFVDIVVAIIASVHKSEIKFVIN